MLQVLFLNIVLLSGGYCTEKGSLFNRNNNATGTGNCRAGTADKELKVQSSVHCAAKLIYTFGPNRGSFNYNKQTGTCSLFKQSFGCKTNEENCENYEVQINEENVSGTLSAQLFDTNYTIICLTNGVHITESYGKCVAFTNTSSEYECVTENLADLKSLLHTNPPYPTQSLYGWIIIQQRLSEELAYNRPWVDYKMGFGSVTSRFSNFWMGLESMHQLTTLAGTGGSAGFGIRFELQSRTNQIWYYAEYSEFWLENETRNYTIHMSGYNGTAGDILNFPANWNYNMNGRPFTTYDRDNDAYSGGNCARTTTGLYGGGWWYNSCFGGSTTGIYSQWFWWSPLSSSQPGAGQLLSASRVMIRKN